MHLISLMATMPSRLSNLPIIRDNYIKAVHALDGKATFSWHLIYWPSEYEAVGNVHEKLLCPFPLRVFSVEPVPGLVPFKKSQSALDVLCSEPRQDQDTFVCLMSDDDLVGTQLFAKLADAFERSQKPLLVTSASRGQNMAKSGHGYWNLTAVPENMHQCLVTGEQIWIHLDLFSGSEKWGNARRLPEDDGLFIEKLYQQHSDWIEFMPDAWMLFNALEPDRWDHEQLEHYLSL